MSNGQKPIKGLFETLVEDHDKPTEVYTEGPNAIAGTYEGNRVPSVGAHARASTGDAVAKSGVALAQANGPAAGAGAHASPLGVGAFANAELGRVEASVAGVGVALAPNINTGASVGADGVAVSVLGFGGSVGLGGIGVKTPLGEVKCCIL